MTPESDTWRDVAAAYDRSLGRLCAGVVPVVLDLLGPPLGRRVLDAGTGTGRLAGALAAAGFQIDAVDPEPAMIDFAAARHGSGTERGPGATRAVSGRAGGGGGAGAGAGGAGAGGVTFRVASLPELVDPFGTRTPSASYDAAVASFVINHTPNPRAALAELARVVRPGGNVVTSIWPTGVSALNSLWTEVIEHAGVSRPVLPRLSHDLDFPRSVDGLHALLDEIGFSRVDVVEERWDFAISPDDLWFTATAGLAVIGAVHRHQDHSGRERLRAEFTRLARRRIRSGVLHFPMTAVVASAQASEVPRASWRAAGR